MNSAPVLPHLLRLLRHLLGARAGNVMAIVALALPAMLVLIGGGIDMSRAYLARTSLQAACDAGVLAGRRAMNKSGSFGQAEQDKARRMFDFNFKGSTVTASNTSFATLSTPKGEVTATARTSVPTTLMRLFGSARFDLAIECGAELQLASADVMFVLDTTGSMACEVDGGNCSSGSASKLQGLRDAVKDFYRTVAEAVVDKDNTRIRFGFVPYSMTVNAHDLIAGGDLPAAYIADSAPYQTRLARFEKPVWVGTAGSPVVTVETFASAITKSNCQLYGSNGYPTSGPNPATSGAPPGDTTTTQYAYGGWSKTSGNGNSAIGTCTRSKAVTSTSYVQRFGFSHYEYRQADLATSRFKGLGSVTYASSVSASASVPAIASYDMVTLAGLAGISGLSTRTGSWNGCIEERATVNDAAMDPVPGGATDLDIVSAPGSPASSWRPLLGELEFYRGNYPSGLNSTSNLSPVTESCPAPMMKFTEVDTADPATVPAWLNSYLSALVARGNTYHDIGMIWGGRLASPGGIMASNVNQGTFNPSRHILFLTDGIMQPSLTGYSAYGIEAYDNRVAPANSSSATLTSYHNARFLAACAAAKTQGYTIWVIGFGVSLTDEMKACASGGRAFASNNIDELKTTFRYIAGEVAELRINR